MARHGAEAQVRSVWRPAGIVIILALAVSSALVWSSYSATLTAGAATADTFTFVADADAYVVQASPQSNYGSSSQLLACLSPLERSYLRFTVAGVTQPVVHAQLVLNATSTNSGAGLHQAQDTTWSESAITWSNAPSFGTTVARSGKFTPGAVGIDVSSLVAGDGAYTFVITSPNNTVDRFSSRESGAASAPRLVVTESPPPTPSGAAANPIRHIVIFFQENHSFDNVLGPLCAANTRRTSCAGVTTGLLYDGATIPLARPPDIVPDGVYNTTAQQTAIDGGKMDGFAKLGSCAKSTGYRCYSAYQQDQIPNLDALATTFAVSDRTFEQSPVPSWSGHMELASGTLDGFTGLNPMYNTNQTPSPPPQGRGWGCDSNEDSPWLAPGATVATEEPSCIPDSGLDPSVHPNGGAYRPTPVQHVDTIMDRLDAAGLSWRLYANNYIWAICPTFADCIYTSQKTNLVPTDQFITDAQNGALPSFSVLLPSGGANGPTSQHNGTSMAAGDNWIGQAVSAVENGPDWSTTAIFITYDDNGGFYDHMPPFSPSVGIRVPMVIVSPYVKSGYTDSNDATFASLLAFTEHSLGLSSLAAADAAAYDYANAFDFSQTPIPGVRMVQQAIPQAEQQYLTNHPGDLDDGT